MQPKNAWAHYAGVGWRLGLRPHPAFDVEHYLASNPDVDAAGLEPLGHYERHGAAEGRTPNRFFQHPYAGQPGPGETPLSHYLRAGWRDGVDPGPDFDTRAYRDVYTRVIDPDECPLLHYLREGAAMGLDPCPEPRTRPTILFVAHMAGARLYGGERSFLDLLQSVDGERYEIVAALPDPDASYSAAVQAHARTVVAWPRRWWGPGDADAHLVDRFSGIIRAHDVRLVYANTLMLREVFTAARMLDVPSICHVRELVRQDQELCEQIGSTPERIMAAVAERADLIVANSNTTAAEFQHGAKVAALPNMVDLPALDLPRLSSDQPLRVGMISSNVAKKGVEDVLLLAREAASVLPTARFSLIGPRTADLDSVMDAARAEGLENFEAPGYASRPEDAVARLHVVLVFSRFGESFGRTAAEAMAARRAVIAYRRGASPEVVGEEGAGFLIPAGEPLAALPILQQLADDPEFYARTGEAARKRVEQRFSPQVFRTRLNAILSEHLSSVPGE